RIGIVVVHQMSLSAMNGFVRRVLNRWSARTSASERAMDSEYTDDQALVPPAHARAGAACRGDVRRTWTSCPQRWPCRADDGRARASTGAAFRSVLWPRACLIKSGPAASGGSRPVRPWENVDTAGTPPRRFGSVPGGPRRYEEQREFAAPRSSARQCST